MKKLLKKYGFKVGDVIQVFKLGRDHHSLPSLGQFGIITEIYQENSAYKEFVCKIYFHTRNSNNWLIDDDWLIQEGYIGGTTRWKKI